MYDHVSSVVSNYNNLINLTPLMETNWDTLLSRPICTAQPYSNAYYYVM